jgi:hypothetical protein
MTRRRGRPKVEDPAMPQKLQLENLVALVKFAIRNGMYSLDWRAVVVAVLLS